MHEKEIPGFRRVSSNAGEPSRALRVRKASPQFEAEAFASDSGDPEHEPPAWSPLTGVSAKISGYLDQMGAAGRRIMEGVKDVARDAAASVEGSFNEAAEAGAIMPGEEFAIAGQRFGAAVSERAREAQAALQPKRSCGYIRTADGRVYDVPCAEDPVAQGERARSALQTNALRGGNYDAALERAKLQLAARKEAARQDEYSRAFALKERQVAQGLDIGELQERALELAIERETSSSAQRALWGRPSTIGPEPPSHRTVKQIGPGVPGGIQERLY